MPCGWWLLLHNFAELAVSALTQHAEITPVDPIQHSHRAQDRETTDLAGAESALQGLRIAVARRRTGAAACLVNDAADGARTAAALRPAAETAIDLANRVRPPRLDGGADILIAQHIARTDNHGAMVLNGDLA